jgi:thiol-disulfide isomerase/thioredoxin
MNSNTRTINEADFAEEFGNLIKDKQSFFAYFHGAYDNETNKSWCSDCDVAKPIIDEILPSSKVPVIKLPIVDVKEWKKPDYEYRINPKVKLSKVPTLIYYDNGVEFGRLTEGELFDKQNVSDFINQIP